MKAASLKGEDRVEIVSGLVPRTEPGFPEMLGV